MCIVDMFICCSEMKQIQPTQKKYFIWLSLILTQRKIQIFRLYLFRSFLHLSTVIVMNKKYIANENVFLCMDSRMFHESSL